MHFEAFLEHVAAVISVEDALHAYDEMMFTRDEVIAVLAVKTDANLEGVDPDWISEINYIRRQLTDAT